MIEGNNTNPENNEGYEIPQIEFDFDGQIA